MKIGVKHLSLPDNSYLQGGPKKLAHLVLNALISSNLDRFSYLFQCQNQTNICNNTVTKYLAPYLKCVVLLHYLARCRCLKSNNWKQNDFFAAVRVWNELPYRPRHVCTVPSTSFLQSPPFHPFLPPTFRSASEEWTSVVIGPWHRSCSLYFCYSTNPSIFSPPRQFFIYFFHYYSHGIRRTCCFESVWNRCISAFEWSAASSGLTVNETTLANRTDDETSSVCDVGTDRTLLTRLTAKLSISCTSTSLAYLEAVAPTP